MIKDVKFSKETTYRGRNGYGRQTGIGIQSYTLGDDEIVVLNPINSSNSISDSCIMRIPAEDVPAVIKALQLVVTGTELPTLTKDQLADVEAYALKKWEDRRQAQGYKTSHLTTKRFQCEFIMGMVAVTDLLTGAEQSGKSSISPRIMFGMMRGDYIE